MGGAEPQILQECERKVQFYSTFTPQAAQRTQSLVNEYQAGPTADKLCLNN